MVPISSLSSQLHCSGAFRARPSPIVESSARPHGHLPLVLRTPSPPGHPIPCCRYLELSGGEERATSPLQARVGSAPYLVGYPRHSFGSRYFLRFTFAIYYPCIVFLVILRLSLNEKPRVSLSNLSTSYDLP